MSQNDRPPNSVRSLIERLAAGLNAEGVPVINPNEPSAASQPARQAPAAVEPLALRFSSALAPRRQNRPPAVSLAQLEENGMVALRRHRHVGEEFRIVRHHVLEHLQQTQGQHDPVRRNNIVLVTSPRDGDGKSFAALNLAGLLAEGGDRDIVLVDADFGGASLTAHFGLAESPGLLEFGDSPRQLAGSIPLGTAIDRLVFIPVGGSADAESRTALAAQRHVRSLASAVADSYEDAIVVVDAPACLTRSDATEISAIAGQVILVVQAGQTRRAEIEQSLDLLDSCPQLSLLLNRAATRRRGLFAKRG
jgi:Mrp family chromosome partitioning ATPase